MGIDLVGFRFSPASLVHMEPHERTSLSKFLSFVLRHEPQSIGLELDSNGWTALDELVRKSNAHGKQLSRELVLEIVATSPKQRFALSDDQLRIRANQGHSVAVDLAYAPAEPPEFLFHGTAASNLDAIRSGGLQKMSRHHVHLSVERDTARQVGARRGEAIVLRVAAGRMRQAGHLFFCSANGVWLTEHVPAGYIDFGP